MPSKKKKPQDNVGSTVGYIRKSVIQWPEGCTTPEQRRAHVDDLRRIRVHELIADAARDGRTVDAWYDDMGVSGRGEFLDKRVEFDRLTREAKSGLVGHVYARDLSRLFRDLVQQEMWFAEMDACGCAVHIQDLPFIADEATRVLLRQQLGSLNQYFATRQGQVIRATNRERVKSGAWVGRSRSQWGLTYNSDAKRFDPDPATADRAVFVFETFAACQGFGTRTARALNALIAQHHPRATPTPKGALWGCTTVLQFVRNEVYRRRITYGEVERDAADLIPEVVPPALVAEADRLLALRGGESYFPGAATAAETGRRAGRADYTYGSILRCGYCGSRMRAHRRRHKVSARPWLTWVCRRRDSADLRCPDSRGFAQDRLDALVKAGIGEALARYADERADMEDGRELEGRADLSVPLASADPGPARTPARTDKDTLRTALDRLAAKQRRYYELFAAGVIESVDEIKGELAALGEERRRLEAKIAEVGEGDDGQPRDLGRLSADEWGRVLRAFALAWPGEGDMEAWHPAKYDLLQSLGVRLSVRVAPRALMSEGATARFGGPLTVRLEIAALGLTDERACEITETEEQFQAAHRARFVRDSATPPRGEGGRFQSP